MNTTVGIGTKENHEGRCKVCTAMVRAAMKQNLIELIKQ
uniref:Uncharacterized protein n=1 Tax=Arundo donax TaxID=35708 RepID=A0A0A9BWM5_ARUDO